MAKNIFCQRTGCGNVGTHLLPAVGQYLCRDCFKEYTAMLSSRPKGATAAVAGRDVGEETRRAVREFLASPPAGPT